VRILEDSSDKRMRTLPSLRRRERVTSRRQAAVTAAQGHRAIEDIWDHDSAAFLSEPRPLRPRFVSVAALTCCNTAHG